MRNQSEFRFQLVQKSIWATLVSSSLVINEKKEKRSVLSEEQFKLKSILYK